MTVSAMKPRWTPADSLDLYNIRGWGNGYFSVNAAGNMLVHPGGPEAPSIDLKELVDEVRRARHRPAAAHPLLGHPPGPGGGAQRSLPAGDRRVRLQGRCTAASTRSRSTRTATSSSGIVEYGRPYHYGLEAGSKPELLAVMAMLEDAEALIVCNGYKDEEYVETALLASKLGRTRHPRRREALRAAAHRRALRKRTGIKPRIGIRAKLSTRGSGRWEASGGDRSKFGLSSARDDGGHGLLREHGMLDSFELLHFHLGSQISPSARQERPARGGAASTSSW